MGILSEISNSKYSINHLPSNFFTSPHILSTFLKYKVLKLYNQNGTSQKMNIPMWMKNIFLYVNCNTFMHFPFLLTGWGISNKINYIASDWLYFSHIFWGKIYFFNPNEYSPTFFFYLYFTILSYWLQTNFELFVIFILKKQYRIRSED